MPYEPIKLPDRVQLSEDEAIQKSESFLSICVNVTQLETLVPQFQTNH